MSEEIVNAFAAAEPAKPSSFAELRPKMLIQGTVKQLELYGAFVDVGVGMDGLIHISQLSKQPVNRVSDVLGVGDRVNVWVERVDQDRQQFTLTMIEPPALDYKKAPIGCHTTSAFLFARRRLSPKPWPAWTSQARRGKERASRLVPQVNTGCFLKRRVY